MEQASAKNKKRKRLIFNIAFYGIILFFLVNTTARSWLLRGALKTGLFSPGITATQSENEYVAQPLLYRDENGEVKSTADLKDRVVFINFWASWCPPCIAEMPSLDELYKEFSDDPAVVFLFINLDDTESAGRNYLRKNQFLIPFQQPKGSIPDDLFSGTLPTTIVLNKRGSVVMKHTGLGNYNTKKFIRQLRESSQADDIQQ